MHELSRWIITGFALIILMSGTAWAMGLEASAGVWNQSPNGDLSFKPISQLDDLNLKSDLDYHDTRRIFGRVKIDTPLLFPNIYLMATPMRFDSTGSKDVAFTFGGLTFNGNVPFSSDLKLDHYDIGLYYGIPGLRTLSDDLLNLELGIDVRAIDFKASITGTEDLTGITVTESKDLRLAAPMLYAGIRINPVKWLALEGEGRGITYRGNHFYDFMGRIKVIPVKPVFLAVGYRYEKVDFDESDMIIDARFHGLTGEAGVEF